MSRVEQYQPLFDGAPITAAERERWDNFLRETLAVSDLFIDHIIQSLGIPPEFFQSLTPQPNHIVKES